MGTTRYPDYTDGSIQYPDETPVHNVTISSPIEVGIYEITQAQWKAVMGIDNNPSYYKGNNLPVQGISWSWAVEYIKALNIMTNQAYRLTTEAEWEYCATGGPNHKDYYYAGSDNYDEVAWTDGNSDYKPHPVGSKAPNSCGVYDMSGNVSEWCLDWMHKYTADDVTDPTGPEEGELKIMRGGSGQSYVNFTRVTARNYDKPDYGSSSSAGFRVVHRW